MLWALYMKSIVLGILLLFVRIIKPLFYLYWTNWTLFSTLLSLEYARVLDKLKVERERGITIDMQQRSRHRLDTVFQSISSLDCYICCCKLCPDVPDRFYLWFMLYVDRFLCASYYWLEVWYFGTGSPVSL
jgi:hypothetical protein